MHRQVAARDQLPSRNHTTTTTISHHTTSTPPPPQHHPHLNRGVSTAPRCAMHNNAGACAYGAPIWPAPCCAAWVQAYPQHLLVALSHPQMHPLDAIHLEAHVHVAIASCAAKGDVLTSVREAGLPTPCILCGGPTCVGVPPAHVLKAVACVSGCSCMRHSKHVERAPLCVCAHTTISFCAAGLAFIGSNQLSGTRTTNPHRTSLILRPPSTVYAAPPDIVPTSTAMARDNPRADGADHQTPITQNCQKCKPPALCTAQCC